LRKLMNPTLFFFFFFFFSFFFLKSNVQYTGRCALQMARGALLAGRSVMAIAVTGQAGPVPDRAASDKAGVPFNTSLAQLGVVDFGAALRVRGKGDPPATMAAMSPLAVPATMAVHDSTVHWTMCEKVTVAGTSSPWVATGGHVDTRALCAQYRAEALADPEGHVSLETITRVRAAVRLDTATQALRAARAMLESEVLACAKKTTRQQQTQPKKQQHHHQKHDHDQHHDQQQHRDREREREHEHDGSAMAQGAATCAVLGNVPGSVYDGDYLACGEPSGIIRERLQVPVPSDAPLGTCDDVDVTWPTPAPSSTPPAGSPTPGPDGGGGDDDRKFALKEFVGGLAMGLIGSVVTVAYFVYRERVRESTRLRVETSLIHNEAEGTSESNPGDDMTL
jgi:hypothetical protein